MPRNQAISKSGHSETSVGGPHVPQQKQTPDGKPIAEKGLGYYPISDMQFDVVTLVYEKSRALQAYDYYLRDSIPNAELREVIEQIARDDRKHIEMLKNFLGNC